MTRNIIRATKSAADSSRTSARTFDLDSVESGKLSTRSNVEDDLDTALDLDTAVDLDSSSAVKHAENGSLAEAIGCTAERLDFRPVRRLMLRRQKLAARNHTLVIRAQGMQRELELLVGEIEQNRRLLGELDRYFRVGFSLSTRFEASGGGPTPSIEPHVLDFVLDQLSRQKDGLTSIQLAARASSAGIDAIACSARPKKAALAALRSLETQGIAYRSAGAKYRLRRDAIM